MKIILQRKKRTNYGIGPAETYNMKQLYGFGSKYLQDRKVLAMK